MNRVRSGKDLVGRNTVRQLMVTNKPMPHPLADDVRRWAAPSPWLQYGAAVAGVAAALVLSLLLRRLVADTQFLFFYLAVSISGWYGGLVPGLLAGLLSALAVNYFVQEPLHALSFGGADLLRLAIFFGVAGVTGWLYEQRRRAEDTIFQQREWFSTTLASIGDGMIATDLEGCIIFMNPAASALTGWKISDALGHSIQEVFHIINENTRQPVENPVLKVLEHGAVAGLANHTILIARDGTEHAIDDSGAPIRDRRDNMIGTVLIFRDVTDERRAETELRHARTELAEIIDSIDDAFYALDRNWRFDYVNPKAAQLWHKTAAELIHQNIWEVFPGGVEGEAYQQLHQVIQSGTSRHFETLSGFLGQWVGVNAYPRAGGGLVVHFRDISERKLRVERLQTLYQLAAQLSQAATLIEVLGVIAESRLKVVPARVQSVALLAASGDELEMLSAADADSETGLTRSAVPLTLSAPANDVVLTGKPLWFETEGERVQKYPEAAGFACCPGAWAVLPLNIKGRTIGAISISLGDDHPIPADEREFLMALADQCGQAIERARLYERERQALRAAEVARSDLEFLTEASTLLIRSLEYKTTLQHIASLVVPRLSDFCGIDLLADNQSIQRVVLAHRNPNEADLIQQLSAIYPIDLNAEFGTGKVIRTGETELVEDVSDELLERAIPDPEQRRQTRELNIASYINTPLVARGKVFGAFSVAFLRASQRRYTASDLPLVRELAQRIAAAIDNARLYRDAVEQRALAEALRDTGMALNSSLELGVVFDRILMNLKQVVQHDAANIMVIRDDTAHVIRSHGYGEHDLAEFEAAIRVLPLAPDTAPLLVRMRDTHQPEIVTDVGRYRDQYPTAERPGIDKTGSALGAPIITMNTVIGFINLTNRAPGSFTPVHAERLQAFASQAAIAIRNAQLYEQAREVAVYEERQRLARDLHDAVSQTLFSASVITESLPRLWEREPEKMADRLDQLNRLTRGAMAEMRALLLELRPTMLLNSRLSELLPQLVEAIKGRKLVAFSLDIDDQEPQPETVHLALYRIAQESLNNIVKHSAATEVTITCHGTADQVELTISDNGVGFDTSLTKSGFGMNTMRERAEAAGMSLRVSSQPGAGTTVSVTWKRP